MRRLLGSSGFMWGIVAAWLLGPLMAGCGSGRSDLAPVSGKVTLDGQPLAKALVEFIPEGTSGVVAIGRTDEQGNYTLMASRSAQGATIGPNKVRITTFEIIDDNGRQRVVPERVPSRYNSQTELRVTVAPRSNTLNFELTTAGGRIDQPQISRANLQ